MYKIKDIKTENNRTTGIMTNIFGVADDNKFVVRIIPKEKNTTGNNLIIINDDVENYIHPNTWNERYDGFRHEPMFGLSADEVTKIADDTWEDTFMCVDNTTFNSTDAELIEEVSMANSWAFE